MTPDTGQIYTSGAINVTDDYELLEYTGIKDKNGLDVYEGDVLFAAIKGGFTYTGPVKFFEEFGIFGIAMVEKFKYNAANPGLPLGSSGSSTNYKPYNWKSYRSIEVIGNIYETPDIYDKGNR